MLFEFHLRPFENVCKIKKILALRSTKIFLNLTLGLRSWQVVTAPRQIIQLLKMHYKKDQFKTYDCNKIEFKRKV